MSTAEPKKLATVSRAAMATARPPMADAGEDALVRERETLGQDDEPQDHGGDLRDARQQGHEDLIEPGIGSLCVAQEAAAERADHGDREPHPAEDTCHEREREQDHLEAIGEAEGSGTPRSRART